MAACYSYTHNECDNCGEKTKDKVLPEDWAFSERYCMHLCPRCIENKVTFSQLISLETI